MSKYSLKEKIQPWAEILLGNSGRVQNLLKQEGNLEALEKVGKIMKRRKKLGR